MQLLVLVPVPVLVPVLLVLLRLVVQGHQLLLELPLLEQRPVRLWHSHHLHNQCWRRMLNRSYYHMMSHSWELLRSKLELVHSRKGLVRSMMELVRSRLALACSA